MGRLVTTFHRHLVETHAAIPSVVRLSSEGLKAEAFARLLIEVWPQIINHVDPGAAMITITDPISRSDDRIKLPTHELVVTYGHIFPETQPIGFVGQVPWAEIKSVSGTSDSSARQRCRRDRRLAVTNYSFHLKLMHGFIAIRIR